ncbi:hypothetical protein [Crocosphaera sp. XPORK-15E]|uniref:hypothetical protein n=1 Tax=Crocosphaera sp. XPORK-15E TaxID=3110247 RepID=UPI002B212443|nr:hypothetical protein [Crocosphaera sp. XPORK-15E]MEA5536103.1 hypothetical protein [Crocosphaera sp. XPORK-15E]
MMNKYDWIRLINAIRIRKTKYKEKYGEIEYQVWYRKANNNRNYGIRPESHSVNLAYDELGLQIKDSSSSLNLTCVYGYQITSNPQKNEVYSLEKIERFHSGEVFFSHISTGHPTTHNGGLKGSIIGGSDTNNFADHCGLYTAAFFYALNVKNPILKYKNKEWIIEDSQLGQFDLISYLSHHQVIPISLPFPAMIDEKDTKNFKLAEGIDLTNLWENEDNVRQDLDDIRKEIYQGKI